MGTSLSILIPTYRRARWLETLLRAIAADPAVISGGVTVLVSDNASPDHTVATVRFLQEELRPLDLRLKVQDENLGAIANIRWLVDAAVTEYVWLFGDDDQPRPGAIGYVLETLSRIQPAVLHVPYNNSPCPSALEPLASSRELLLRYHHWISFVTSCVVRRDALVRAMADAPTDNPWAPHIWYSIAGREKACAVVPQRLVSGGSTEISWADRFRLYMTTGVIDAFDAGFCLVVDEYEYGRLVDDRYRQYGAQDWEAAPIEELIAAVARFPTSRLMRQVLLRLARRHGRADAFAAVDAAVRAAGDVAVADELVADGERRYLIGDLAGAAGAFHAAIDVRPTDVVAWCDLGVVLNAQGQFPAGDAFDRALEIEPDHVDALLSRASWSMSRGLRGQAVHDAQRVLKLHPDDLQARGILATVGGTPSSA